jgi:hypothetical protein
MTVLHRVRRSRWGCAGPQQDRSRMTTLASSARSTRPTSGRRTRRNTAMKTPPQLIALVLGGAAVATLVLPACQSTATAASHRPAPQQHGVHVDELDEFALHAPVPPRRIVRRDADDKLPDGGCHGRSSGTPPACVIPCAGDQSPVPGEQRRRGHREHLGPPLPGDQLGQRREPQPVARLAADPADLAAQYRVLVPEYQEFGVLGHLTPGVHHQAAEQAARDQVDDPEDHSAMIPTRQAAPGQIQ